MNEVPPQTIRKIQTLAQIVAELAQGNDFNITRLTLLESLCGDADNAAAFSVEDPDAVADLLVEMEYDDAFVAYVNGVEILRSNNTSGQSGTPQSSEARAARRLYNGKNVERFLEDLESFPDLLQPGNDNILAIQGINARPTDRDFVLSGIRLSALSSSFGQLQAGDADQDLDFDQLDLVQVQIAAKYLTGQAATWGEGDWNGAPGGSAGNPPAGDGLFNQFHIIAAQQAAAYLTGPYAAIQPGGQRGDGQTSVVYNPSTGEVAVDAPNSVELTSINIDSAAGIFTGESAQNLAGSFDNDADNNIFKATFGSSFGTLSFGNAAQLGLSEDFVLNDLTVVGSLARGGDLGNVDLIYVPEPTTLVLLTLGLLGLVAYGSGQRSRRVK